MLLKSGTRRPYLHSFCFWAARMGSNVYWTLRRAAQKQKRGPERQRIYKQITPTELALEPAAFHFLVAA
jgi:hypothetical protein